MLKQWRRGLAVVFTLLLAALAVAGCAGTPQDAGGTAIQAAQEAGAQRQEDAAQTGQQQPEFPEETGKAVDHTGAAELSEDGSYTSRDEVALYLHIYGHLPDNFITKKEAENLGWDSRQGNLWDVAPGMSIGGSRFGNYEGLLPEEDGRNYYECDIDYDGGYRGKKRMIYSNDGLIFYTEDHYESFEQLY